MSQVDSTNRIVKHFCFPNRTDSYTMTAFPVKMSCSVQRPNILTCRPRLVLTIWVPLSPFLPLSLSPSLLPYFFLSFPPPHLVKCLKSTIFTLHPRVVFFSLVLCFWISLQNLGSAESPRPFPDTPTSRQAITCVPPQWLLLTLVFLWSCSLPDFCWSSLIGDPSENILPEPPNLFYLFRLKHGNSWGIDFSQALRLKMVYTDVWINPKTHVVSLINIPTCLRRSTV